jgi:apolipoprotein D and lipocalin family protein
LQLQLRLLFHNTNSTLHCVSKMKIFVFFILFLSAISAWDPLTTVADLDLDRYAGLWYQLADYPQFYELLACQDCVTAQYSIDPINRTNVQVTNQALGINNCAIQGTAKLLDPKFPGQLKIRFKFIPGIVPDSLLPDYWIVDIGKVNADGFYSWAIVSNPKRSSCYVLARSPKVEDALLQELKGKLTEHGFDLGKLKWTNQDAKHCGYTM